jgi:hypothetical protein
VDPADSRPRAATRRSPDVASRGARSPSWAAGGLGRGARGPATRGSRRAECLSQRPARRYPCGTGWLGPTCPGRRPPSWRPGDRIVACYSVAAAAGARTKHDKPYLRLQLSDLHGTVEARVWDDAERLARGPAGRLRGRPGRVEVFQGQRQVVVEQLERVQVDPDDLGLFLPRCPRDSAELEAALMDLMASVKEEPLRKLLRHLLGPKTETGRGSARPPPPSEPPRVRGRPPGAHRVRHPPLRRHGPPLRPVVDRDLLVTGALLHDIGKVQEIAIEAGFPYTTAGKLLGHILLGPRDGPRGRPPPRRPRQPAPPGGAPHRRPPGPLRVAEPHASPAPSRPSSSTTPTTPTPRSSRPSTWSGPATRAGPTTPAPSAASSSSTTGPRPTPTRAARRPHRPPRPRHPVPVRLAGSSPRSGCPDGVVSPSFQCPTTLTGPTPCDDASAPARCRWWPCSWRSFSASLEAQTKLLRFPAVNGDRVAFTYAGDLWTVPSPAAPPSASRRIPGSSCSRLLSRRHYIAFTGQYDGDEQVYVVPASGGVPKQLTFYPAGPAGRALGLRPPGLRLDAGREPDPLPLGRDGWSFPAPLYTVPATGGPAEALPMPRPGPAPSPRMAAYRLLAPLPGFPLREAVLGWHGQPPGDLRPGGQRGHVHPRAGAGAAGRHVDRGPDLLQLGRRRHLQPLLLRPAHRRASPDHELRGVGRPLAQRRSRPRAGSSSSWAASCSSWTRAPVRSRPCPSTSPTTGSTPARPAWPWAGRSPASASAPTASAPSSPPAAMSSPPHRERPDPEPHGQLPVPRQGRRLVAGRPQHRLPLRPHRRGGAVAGRAGRAGRAGAADPGRPGHALQPHCWSPDGSRIAFSDKDGKLWVLTMDGRRLTEIADDPRGTIGDYAWSPRGNHLAFSLADPRGARAIHIWSAGDGASGRSRTGSSASGAPPGAPTVTTSTT